MLLPSDICVSAVIRGWELSFNEHLLRTSPYVGSPYIEYNLFKPPNNSPKVHGDPEPHSITSSGNRVLADAVIYMNEVILN